MYLNSFVRTHLPIVLRFVNWESPKSFRKNLVNPLKKTLTSVVAHVVDLASLC